MRYFSVSLYVTKTMGPIVALLPRTGLDTEARGKILSPLLGIELQSPGRLARSQTLYWLRYPAHIFIMTA
jgi:hypothetical protein